VIEAGIALGGWFLYIFLILQVFSIELEGYYFLVFLAAGAWVVGTLPGAVSRAVVLALVALAALGGASVAQWAVAAALMAGLAAGGMGVLVLGASGTAVATPFGGPFLWALTLAAVGTAALEAGLAVKAAALCPLLWLALLRAPQGRHEAQRGRDWAFTVLRTLVVFLVLGVFWTVMLEQFAALGWVHRLMLPLGLVLGGLLLAHGGLWPVVALAASLVIFGLMVSTASYVLSDFFLGLAVGGILVQMGRAVHSLSALHRALAIASAALVMALGGLLGRVLLQGLQYEGLALLSFLVLVAGTAPGLLASRRQTAPPALPRDSRGLHKSPEQLALQHGLSKREAQVLRLLLQGKSTKQIAQELYISESTVKTHTRRIYDKLQVNTRAELLGKCFSEEAS
jgi:DNA-binding CsgD family transcriptional regulator